MFVHTVRMNVCECVAVYHTSDRNTEVPTRQR